MKNNNFKQLGVGIVLFTSFILAWLSLATMNLYIFIPAVIFAMVGVYNLRDNG